MKGASLDEKLFIDDECAAQFRLDGVAGGLVGVGQRGVGRRPRRRLDLHAEGRHVGGRKTDAKKGKGSTVSRGLEPRARDTASLLPLKYALFI